MSIDAEALKIVEAALAVDDPDGRQAIVAGMCGTNTALRARVEALLAHEDTAFRLTPTESFARPLSVVDVIPDRIGPYRITGEIARGGMGAVVRAVRDDGVFEQDVAIKLIRADLASQRARKRFEDERRILARLRHPGIVRILDGGETGTRPWLAMDFVDGRPITEALVGKDRATRLDAFEAVCEAVAHAHRNLVVHADIKPSNVLMGEDGRVHLLDFGIARLILALDDEEAGDPYPLTKGYAAPERGVGVAPTIASDVFSLGVLLLGMLGCRVPAEESGFVAGTRLPVGQLDGDLAAIAARALAEQPGLRYPDVPALLSDIRRSRAFVPVAARDEAGWRYAAGKFVMRHRRGLALTAVAAGVLLVATFVSTTQYLRAEHARAQADARFLEVRRLANFQLFDLYDRLSQAPGTVGARAEIARSAGEYLDRLRAVPDAPADLRLESAMGYRRLAAVSGLSGTASLGKPDAARAALAKADALLASVRAERPSDVAALVESGWVEADRWTLLANAGESTATNLRARNWFDAALTRDPANVPARIGRLTTEKNEAYDLTKGAGKAKAAIPILAKALADLRRMRPASAWQMQARMLEYELLSKLGDATYYGGDSAGSLPHYQAALGIADQRLQSGGDVPAWLARRGEALWNISGVIEEQPGRKAEALAMADAGVAALDRVLDYGPDANAEKKLAILQSQRGLLSASLGNSRDAIAAMDRSIAIRSRRLAEAPDDPVRTRDLVIAQMSYADVLFELGKPARGCEMARSARDLWTLIERRGDLTDHDRGASVARLDKLRREKCR